MTLRRLKDILFVLTVFGIVAALIRMTRGLGVATALSDGIPWGFWKVLNMIAGVALATGGFVLAFFVHVLRIKSLSPLLRPALVVAFLGYGSSCLALLLDIGLPHRFWHPILHWNVHSFLFEVFWCVMLYFTVTLIEVSPIALEGSRFKKTLRLIRWISGPVVILGITFSMLHHSSLGSLFLVSAGRLHELWYTPWLPVHFILSAVGAGMMSVVLLTLVVARLYGRTPPMDALRKLAVASSVVLTVYLATKIADFAGRGAFGVFASGQWEVRLFVLELLCAVIVPVVLIALPRVRRSQGGLAIAASFAVFGLVLNRLDVGIFAYFRSGATTYVPSLSELAVTLGIPAAAGLFFFAFIERHRVFDFGVQRLGPEAVEPVPAFQKQTGVWRGVFLDNLERLSLIAVVAAPLAVLFFTPSAGAKDLTTRAPLGADETRAVLRIDGDRDGEFVLFEHEIHQERLGGDSSCSECHHLDRPGDKWTACYSCHAGVREDRSIFDHGVHVEKVAAKSGFTGALAGNFACSECHDPAVPSTRETAKACQDCHAEDMRMGEDGGDRPDLAPAYVDALHQSCVKCHESRAEEAGRPELGECQTCHPRAGEGR